MDLARSQMVAFPLSSLAALRQALIRDAGDAGASMLQEAGYAGGDAVFGAFRTWLDEHGLLEPERLGTDAFQRHAADFFRDAGWGSLTISALHDVVAMVDSVDWIEADPQTAFAHPSCHLTTGLFADFFGRTAGAPLAVLETECRSAGGHQCRFLIGSAEVMGHLYDRMTAGASYADAAAELV